MLKISKLIDNFRGRICIDNALIASNVPILLHISDTPSQFYPELSRIIGLIGPKYIIHTGDLADNIKCELSPSLLNKYRHEAGKLLTILNSSNAEDIYISLGNHDDYDFINKNKGRLQIYTEMGEINVNDIKFAFSHYPDYLKGIDADVHLFGHNIKSKTLISDSKIYLNGISSINAINLDTLQVICIEYPFGTDRARLNKNKIGI